MKSNGLSVVIPVYNEEAAIGECLTRLLAQTRPIDEILVIDNNSTDRTAAVVAEFTASNRRAAAGRDVPTQRATIRLVTETQQGALFAAARGIREAEGEFVAKIDADTLVPPGWSQAIADFFDAAPDDVAGGSGMCSMHDMPFQGPFRRMQAGVNEKIVGMLARGEVNEMRDSFGANFVMRAKVWAEIADTTSTRTDIQDDLDIGICVANAGWKLTLVPNMAAEVSGRRMLTSPLSYWQYTARTPRTLRMHGERKRLLLANAGAMGARALHAVLFPVLMFWDPDAKSFKLKHAVSRPEARVLP